MSEKKDADMKSNISVSFVIPNWNHRQLLSECISSIIKAAKMSHEIIIVDNASTDGAREHIEDTFHEIIWVQNTMNVGYAKAVNQGVALSRGDFIFLLNNDVKLLPDSVERLAAFLSGHPEAGAVAPLLLYPDGRVQLSCRRFPTPVALLLELARVDKAGPFRRWKLTVEEHLGGGIVPQPMASALMIKRECWSLVGPLDEGFPIFFNDVDWCYRLYRDGRFAIFLYPEVRTIHHYGASTNRLRFRKKIEFYKGLIKFYRKHRCRIYVAE